MSKGLEVQETENRNDRRVSTAFQLANALGITLDELCRDETTR